MYLTAVRSMPLPRCHHAKKRAAAAAAAGLHGRHDGRAQRNQAQLAADANAGQGRAHPLSVSQYQAPWQCLRLGPASSNKMVDTLHDSNSSLPGTS